MTEAGVRLIIPTLDTYVTWEYEYPALTPLTDWRLLVWPRDRQQPCTVPHMISWQATQVGVWRIRMQIRRRPWGAPTPPWTTWASPASPGCQRTMGCPRKTPWNLAGRMTMRWVSKIRVSQDSNFEPKFPPTKIRVFWFLDVGSPRSTACHLNLKEPFSIRLKKKVELGRQLLIIVTIGWFELLFSQLIVSCMKCPIIVVKKSPFTVLYSQRRLFN